MISIFFVPEIRKKDYKHLPENIQTSIFQKQKIPRVAWTQDSGPVNSLSADMLHIHD